MKKLVVRRGIVAGALLLAPVAAGCAGGEDAGGGSSPSVAGSPASRFNAADVSYVQGMIPHHEQAIEIADIALDPSSGASARAKELAQKTRSAQDPEVQRMRALLKLWGKTEAHDTSAHAEHGMLEPKELAAMDELTGPALDKKFAELMIRHHEGAIAQSEKIKASGSSAEVKALADGIIAGQRAELTDLKLLAG